MRAAMQQRSQLPGPRPQSLDEFHIDAPFNLQLRLWPCPGGLDMASRLARPPGGGILLSAQSTVDAITEQVDACLEKPIKMANLLECVQDILA